MTETADLEAIEAIRVVRKYLREQWISEGCQTHQVWGCASCQAVRLDRDLEVLASEMMDQTHVDGADRPHKN